MAKQKQITLESVSSALTHWRAQRLSSSAPVPLILQQQGIQLLQFHSKADVIKALNINHSMLKRWQQQEGQASTSASEFIHLVGESPETSPHDWLQVTLRNGQGSEMKITGMTLSELSTLATHFSTATGESR